MNSPQRNSRWLRWWFAGYIALIVIVVNSMYWARRSALQMSSQESISEWQSWREDVREQQSQHGPVERRMPKSNEPPALVLMRDFFIVMMVGALLFSSMLYCVIAWFVTGIARSRHGLNCPPNDATG